jgi:hypothetical protein
MLVNNIIGSPSFLFLANFCVVVIKKREKIGNFHLKGTFENNCLTNEKRCQTFKPQN